jgi:hypothetical protein
MRANGDEQGSRETRRCGDIFPPAICTNVADRDGAANRRDLPPDRFVAPDPGASDVIVPCVEQRSSRPMAPGHP